MTHPHPIEFDPPAGVYKSAALSKALGKVAKQAGPFSYTYMPIKLRDFRELDERHSDVVRLLVYQLRALYQLFPGVEPELRIYPAADFGRTCGVCWYDVAYEAIITHSYDGGAKWLEATEVLG